MRKIHGVIIKGPAQIILGPYYEENALGVVKGPHPDDTKPVL